MREDSHIIKHIAGIFPDGILNRGDKMVKNERNILNICISILLILSLAMSAAADKIKANDGDDNIDKDWKEPDNVKIGDSKPIITVDPVTKIGRAVFIHWDRNANTGVVINQVSGSCYSTFATRVGNLPVTYRINPINPQGLSGSFITSAISASAETWDVAAGQELFNDAYVLDTRAKFGKRDNKNSIVFGRYYYPSAIAVTATWYNTVSGQIYENDMLFNTDFRWGNGLLDGTKMDMQNIATHEFGHVLGISDIYESSCSDVTMYGYASQGETIRRTLESPDIMALSGLYP